MNSLRKPVFVAALSLAALILVFQNVVRPLVRGHGVKPAPPIAGRSMPSPATRGPQVRGSESKASLDRVLPVVELRSLEGTASQWMRAPARDPFASPFDSKRQASGVLTLKGIWRQSDATFAIINGTVVGRGDRILDFAVESIETDRVWVMGPNGREELSFRVPMAELSSRFQLESKP
jgi:hypothetical protein